MRELAALTKVPLKPIIDYYYISDGAHHIRVMAPVTSRDVTELMRWVGAGGDGCDRRHHSYVMSAITNVLIINYGLQLDFSQRS